MDHAAEGKLIMARKLQITAWEYNVTENECAAMERALLVLMDERGVDEMTIGNVYLYRAGEQGDRVGCWFVDEHGQRIPDVDYTLAHDEKRTD